MANRRHGAHIAAAAITATAPDTADTVIVGHRFHTMATPSLPVINIQQVETEKREGYEFDETEELFRLVTHSTVVTKLLLSS